MYIDTHTDGHEYSMVAVDKPQNIKKGYILVRLILVFCLMYLQLVEYDNSVTLECHFN